MLLQLLGRWPAVFDALVRLQTSQPEVKYFTLRDPEPDRGIAWFILNAFFFIGVALAATLAIGLAFGSFRYWLLERFPHNRLNGAPKDDLSQSFRLSDER